MGDHIFTEAPELTKVVPDFTLVKQVKTTSGVAKFVDITKEQVFDGKKIVLFGLPGAFTPTCSGQQLPGFEALYHEFREAGIDDIYCLSVNDTFVMNEWAIDQGLVNVKLLPDGSAQLAIKLGMDVRKDNLQFGIRCWRVAAVYDNGNLVKGFVEEGFGDNVEGDPYEVSKPDNVLEWVKGATFLNGEDEEGKHIELDISDSTDIKEKLG